ncbi:MAG: PQQ-dependent sugar dehydrogenase [Gemmataceae bacterium]
MRKWFGVFTLVLGVGLLFGFVAIPSGGTPSRTLKAHKIPSKFIPVDTSRLMGSPDPLPLEAKRAFPNLKFKRPIELTYTPDGTDRVFVAEQQGTIQVFENHDGVEKTKTFLDIRKIVSRRGNEEGLLGLAFHPKFQENGEFFVYYSAWPRASIISRFRVSKNDPNKADPQSEERIMKIEQPFSNHNGGCIAFGHDGHLYIGLGDGGSAHDPHANGQNLRTLLGSILRIDVDRQDKGKKYAIPKDNPFVGRPNARGEIWAYGIRNTWRMAFDRDTGDLWMGDIGQNRFEEVNVIRKGGNYGWNIREGFHSFEPNAAAKPNDLIDPVVEYFRQDGQSITGGLVYRGRKLKKYNGAYFYGDYLSGKVFIVRWDGKRVTQNRQVAETNLQIAAFGADQNGDMYLCAFDGNLYRLQPRKVNLKKVASTFPRKLSETGLFASVKDHKVTTGVIPYELNLPFWTDYAIKDRYVAFPKKGQVKFSKTDKWQFPVGTVFAKTFWLHRDRVNLKDPERMETRLWVHSPQGWTGYTYVYNDDKTEAYLLDGSLSKPIQIKTKKGMFTQRYYFPSRKDCTACHNKAANYVLGLTTRQMNRTLRYHGDKENQIEMFNRLGVFTEDVKTPVNQLEKYPDWQFGNLDRDLTDDYVSNTHELPQGNRETLARGWLDINCAVCHRRKGIVTVGGDMRFHQPLKRMNLVNRPPNQGHLSPPNSALIMPGQPYRSELILRASHRGPRQMPPVGSRLVDSRGLEVLRMWIKGMKK